MMQKITAILAFLAIFGGVAHIYGGAVAAIVSGALIWIDLTLEGMNSRNGDQ